MGIGLTPHASTRSDQRSSYSYDAPVLLGLGAAAGEPLPEPAPGDIVIRVGGWSLHDLYMCDSRVRKKRLCGQTWYDRYQWSSQKLTPGMYRVQLPLPESSRETFARQQTLLLPGEQVAPVALALAALLCHPQTGGLPAVGWIRCIEQTSNVHRVAVNWCEGSLSVDPVSDDTRDDGVWACGVRTT